MKNIKGHLITTVWLVLFIPFCGLYIFINISNPFHSFIEGGLGVLAMICIPILFIDIVMPKPILENIKRYLIILPWLLLYTLTSGLYSYLYYVDPSNPISPLMLSISAFLIFLFIPILIIEVILYIKRKRTVQNGYQQFEQAHLRACPECGRISEKINALYCVNCGAYMGIEAVEIEMLHEEKKETHAWILKFVIILIISFIVGYFISLLAYS